MDGEVPNEHLLYTLVVHPSLWSLRLVSSLITVPLSLLLSIVLFPLRIIFLPVASSYTLFTSSSTSSTNPPTPLQFLLSALFFGVVAGFALVIASRVGNAALSVFVESNTHLPSASSSGAKQSLVPSPRAVRKRIQQQLRQAQQLQTGVKDLPPTATVPQKSPQVKLETEQRNWQDKWRQQQQDRRDPKQRFASPPPLSPSAGAGLGPVTTTNSVASPANLPSTHSQTIAEEDSDEDMFYDDETDGF